MLISLELLHDQQSPYFVMLLGGFHHSVKRNDPFPGPGRDFTKWPYCSESVARHCPLDEQDQKTVGHQPELSQDVHWNRRCMLVSISSLVFETDQFSINHHENKSDFFLSNNEHDFHCDRDVRMPRISTLSMS
jgi:hypothetical protein